MTTPALPPSLAPEYTPSSTWLTQDPDPSGKGPVHTGPPSSPAEAVAGTAPVPLNPPPPGFSEGPLQPPDYFPAGIPHAGPWPPLPEEGQGKEPFGTIPPDGIIPAGYYRTVPEATGFAEYTALLPGHDAHSQDTDTYGWDQYSPSGRVARRQRWWQDYPGVEDFWPVTQPNLARVRIARGADQEIGGVIASYGGLANSGGNTAYEPPPPPPVTTQAAPSGTSTIPQWGF